MAIASTYKMGLWKQYLKKKKNYRKSRKMNATKSHPIPVRVLLEVSLRIKVLQQLKATMRLEKGAW